MHSLSISHAVCRNIALSVQGILQVVYDGYVRMSEIQLLTSPDIYTRELAKSAL